MEHDKSDSPPRRRPAPRLYHKKSRLGCLRCKGRRVKCDERRPVCSGCARHDVECVYPSGGSGGGGGSSRAQERGDSGSDGAIEVALSERPERKRSTAEPRPSGFTLYESSSTEDAQGSSKALLESRDRRMTELRLLHHYLRLQSGAFAQKLGTASIADFASRALAGDGGADGDGILYALLAHSALSIWMGTDPDAYTADAKQHHRHLHQQYLSMALRAQRRAVDRLVEASQAASSSLAGATLADNVGSAALLLINHSFALVQTLPLDPWQPPREWLRMGRGAMQVMAVANDFLGLGHVDGESSDTKPKTLISRTAARLAKASTSTLAKSDTTSTKPTTTPTNSLVIRIVQSPPHFDPADMFAAVWAAPYLHLLEEPDQPIADAEPEIDESHDYPRQTVPGLYNPDHSASTPSMTVYYETLSYIGWCAAAIQRADEPIKCTCWRMAAAAYWFPEELEARLDERRPRALVCLAQFFALWIPFEFSPEAAPVPDTSQKQQQQQQQQKPKNAYPVWMMGTAGRRQVAAIHDALPTRWKSKVAPLLEIK